MSQAYDHGRSLARDAVERRRAVRPTTLRRGGGDKGLLIAEGDSWFDYPFYDVLERLEDGGYEVESVAHRGDNVEDMAHDPKQIASLTKKFTRLGERRRNPKAVLLSGGGNDIAGEEFRVLINHANSGLDALNERIVEGVIEGRLRTAVACLMGVITELCRESFGEEKPVLIHGYDYPVPDGRGFWGGAWILPGPWLEPGFRRKGHRVLESNAAVMKTLIDRYNAMLSSLCQSLPNARYVDLRGILSNELEDEAYKKVWENELHPSEAGFGLVAKEFLAVLEEL